MYAPPIERHNKSTSLFRNVSGPKRTAARSVGQRPTANRALARAPTLKAERVVGLRSATPYRSVFSLRLFIREAEGVPYGLSC